jgi:hypothetical protein
MTASTDTVTPADLRRALLSHLAGDAPAAEAGYRRVLSDAALANVARPHLAHLLDDAYRFEEALAVRREVVRAHPQDDAARLELAIALLRLGRYAEGWPLYEARFGNREIAADRPQLPYPEWDGRPIHTLTVWDEQGVGDAILFARFVPALRARGIEPTLVCRPSLAKLFESLGVEVIAATGRIRTPAADAWAMIGSLPGRLQIDEAALPGPIPYLTAPQDQRDAWRPRIGPGARIGVVGRGNPAAAHDAVRSLPPEGVAFLYTLPGAVPLTPGHSPLPLQDFADTAAVIECLDLVITVDTAVAHLAGALGRPCWVMLPYVSTDWRWLHGRTDSPWYPSMRLYRQPTKGDWASVLRAVAGDLPAVFSQKRA